jgi:type IV secretory pathway ATPase VirB11/archaellum biosynthesis ATPase
MVNSQIEAYALKHNRNPSSIEDLIADGFIKEAQKTCKSGESITISNGEAAITLRLLNPLDVIVKSKNILINIITTSISIIVNAFLLLLN